MVKPVVGWMMVLSMVPRTSSHSFVQKISIEYLLWYSARF